ncbi:MAG: hypothetical protein IJT25_01880, partial [Clostridia bacterium]|nr:hypothetical protein [Clostridia bacterium]
AEEINALEKTLDDFNARVSLNKKELESLNEKLNGVNLNYEELAILEKSSIAENSKLSSLKIEQGKKTGELERLESKIEEKLMLSDKKVAIETNLDYAKTLSKLLYGKALAQFICEEYLNNITIRANQILQNLEGGKFTIKFKDNNFLVEDNFNLGKERAASTLSGGETFLISLSLALAISETINIESGENQDFFFLDEGFGTLDSELLETVISALYKLEHQHTIIGVISHVEMLKERIKNKIIVSKTEEEGSKVKLLYTM